MTPRQLPVDLDLDAVAGESEPWTMVLKGQRFTMPGELAAEAIVVYGRWAEAQRQAEAQEEQEANLTRLAAYAHLDRLTSLLFASDEDYARWQELRPSESQRQALVLEAVRRSGGGLEPGEPKASPASSPGTGRPARRTASGSTG